MKNLNVLCLVLFFAGVGITAAETELEKELFEFINSERERQGLKPLLWDDALHKVAFGHSDEMAHTGEVSHAGKNGSQPHDRILSAQIPAAKSAENIARDINVRSAHTMLMQSLVHRENILDPDFTHAAVGIVPSRQYLYLTQLFIHKVTDYAVEEAREILLRQLNFYRQDKKMGPLVLSKSLSNVAQSNAELTEKLGESSPLLTTGILRKQSRGSVLVSFYTTTNLLSVPVQVRSDAQGNRDRIGIGFRRLMRGLCNGACYLVVLIFGSS